MGIYDKIKMDKGVQMTNNQIIVGLQIINNEVRLLVGQFYGADFNIVAKLTKPCTGTNGLRIVDEKAVIECVKQIVNEASLMISAQITSCVLIIPGYRFKKEKCAYNVMVQQGMVSYSDVKAVYKEAFKNKFGNDNEIINVALNSYTLNEITYPKPPIGEMGAKLAIEADLICGDKLIVYDYVGVVEKAGVKVLDIIQDGYAACKEEALFEQSINNLIVNIYIERSHTVYSLIYGGRLVGGFCNNKGFDALIHPLAEKFYLSDESAKKIVFHYCQLDQKIGKDCVITQVEKDGKVYPITYSGAHECIHQALVEMTKDMYLCCKDALSQENVIFNISGEGAGLPGLDKLVENGFKKPVKCYCPDLLGVREHKWTALLGALYCYKEIQTINETNKSCVDMNVYEEHLIPTQNKTNENENTFSGKLKSIAEKLLSDE